ncbi:MAG: ATP-binding protein [Acidobacteria bacterium]|nr:ATP-binding protein [Acidobacteriota bacterium]MYH32074.1 ATP-binding protein [Acidobacteriota bacterium]
MITRSLAAIVTARLRQFPAVALIGPRQVGKTTLARWLAGTADSVYLDLEDPADLAKLDDAAGYLRTLHHRLVVIDEVQRAPGLFQLLRVLVDERIRAGEAAGQFLLLGSAAPDLLRQSGESLAGRIAYLELSPLDVRETGGDLASRLWVRGGFPLSLLAESDWASAEWREQFIRTYLERDVPQLGPRVPSETLRRLWTMLAHGQGSLLNLAALARSLAIDGKTVARYVDLRLPRSRGRVDACGLTS